MFRTMTLGLAAALGLFPTAREARQSEAALTVRAVRFYRAELKQTRVKGLVQIPLAAIAPVPGESEGSYAVGVRVADSTGLTLFHQVGGAQRIASALSNLGDLARAEGDYERARTLLGESLELFGEVRDPWGSGACLESLALVAVAQRQAQRAAVLFGAAEGLRERAGVPLPPADQPERDRALASLRLSLGREALANGRAEGQALSLEGALTLALCAVTEEQQQMALPVNDTPLTEREREVASLIARGLTNRQIAQALVITKQTADKHVGNILGKLGAASRAQVAVWFVQRVPRVAAAAS